MRLKHSGQRSFTLRPEPSRTQQVAAQMEANAAFGQRAIAATNGKVYYSPVVKVPVIVRRSRLKE